VDSGAFQIRKLHVRLNTNMVSMTIENLLSTRKKQVSELAEIVARDMGNQDMAADIVKRTKKLRAVQATVQLQPREAFNINQIFLSEIDKVKNLMPQTGDCIQELYGHSRDVYGLVETDSGFASSSWDSTLHLWTLGDDSTYTSTENHVIQLPSASLSLVAAGVGWVASSQFDGVVSMHSLATGTNAANIQGAEQTTVEGRLGAATKALTLKGSTTAVVSLAVLSIASPLQPGDVTVSVDEAPSLTSSANSAGWLACGLMDGAVSLWEVSSDTSRLVQVVGGHSQAGHGHGHGDGGHSETVRALVWANLGADDVLISGSFDRTIIVWRLTTHSNGGLERIRNLGSEEGAHEGAVTALTCIDAGGASIASAGENSTIKLWNLGAPAQATRTIQLQGKGVCSLAWLTNPTNTGQHNWLACGMGGHTIILCDLETGREVTTMRGHSGAVHALLWLESKGWLVSGSSDATVRTWRVRSGADTTEKK
jgi:WD40 repeat protein